MTEIDDVDTQLLDESSKIIKKYITEKENLSIFCCHLYFLSLSLRAFLGLNFSFPEMDIPRRKSSWNEKLSTSSALYLAMLKMLTCCFYYLNVLIFFFSCLTFFSEYDSLIFISPKSPHPQFSLRNMSSREILFIYLRCLFLAFVISNGCGSTLFLTFQPLLSLPRGKRF